MPAPIISGVIKLLTQQLNITVFDGEVPRYDTAGRPINPDAVTLSPPSTWPAVRVTMPESGFQRSWTTEDPYDDKGELTIQIWSTTRESEEATLTQIESLLAQASNWAQIPLGGPLANPFYVISMLLTRWYSGQEEGVRTAKSELLYRGELHYEVDVHGAIVTL